MFSCAWPWTSVAKSYCWPLTRNQTTPPSGGVPLAEVTLAVKRTGCPEPAFVVAGGVDGVAPEVKGARAARPGVVEGHRAGRLGGDQRLGLDELEGALVDRDVQGNRRDAGARVAELDRNRETGRGLARGEVVD